MNKQERIRKVIHKYLHARRRLFELEEEYPNELSGNDNIIGRIGEYIAIRYLESKKRTAIKNINKSQKGYDLLDTNGCRISVKIITAENKMGRTTRLKQPWDEVILIVLDDEYKISKIGLLQKSEFLKSLNDNKNRSNNPYLFRHSLGEKGLFSIYGVVDKNIRDIL